MRKYNLAEIDALRYEIYKRHSPSIITFSFSSMGGDSELSERSRLEISYAEEVTENELRTAMMAGLLAEDYNSGEKETTVDARPMTVAEAAKVLLDDADAVNRLGRYFAANGLDGTDAFHHADALRALSQK